MGDIKLNVLNLNNLVQAELTRASILIESERNKFSGTKIPDFSYSSYLNEMTNTIFAYKQRMKKIYDFNSDSSKKLADYDASAKGGTNFFQDMGMAISSNPWLSQILGVQQKVASTIAVATTSVLEGVGNVVEGVVDGVIVLGSTIVNALVLPSDIFFGTNATEEIQNWTSATVSKKVVGSLVDDFYTKTKVGKNIADTSYMNPDGVVSNFITGATETAGMLAISVLCPPAGAAVAGLKGAGEGSERAFNEGASYYQGVGYGIASGLLEAGQYYIGGKLGKGILKPGPTSSILGKSLTSLQAKAVNTVVAGATNAIPAMVRPVTEMVYKYDKSENFTTNYQNLLDKNGGWTNVGMQFTIGAGMYAGGEVIKSVTNRLVKPKIITKKVISELDNLEITQENARIAAKTKYYEASLSKSSFIKDFKNLENEQSTLVGLKHQLKTEKSLSEKIYSDAITDNKTLGQVVDNISDANRYTLVIDDNQYTQGVKKSLEAVENFGYKINKVKNSWGDPLYQGVNVQLTNKNGVKAELQFHTSESFYTKEVLNHHFYEIARSKTGYSDHARELAKQVMKINQSYLNVPRDIKGFVWEGGSQNGK